MDIHGVTYTSMVGPGGLAAFAVFMLLAIGAWIVGAIGAAS